MVLLYVGVIEKRGVSVHCKHNDAVIAYIDAISAKINKPNEKQTTSQ